ncbi:hypothetical protein T440DRAFT_468329 [Plenodomus tracheiphilus IPT5]|uniref:Uncharacterized protein n=1 Tax=Plenodomus tracheiphilus IPT5 TaxID=1408161 RepID=A0A6A7B680_9PLEO|nr:hypothetical protein T440DRAFT_468329 [Plenodomus tracheiphilus IPT5]
MSLARAVTKRIKRSDVPKEPTSPPTRSQSMRHPSQQIDRTKISLPLALVSTTNMLSYNAPDIATMRHVSSSTSLSHSSADDSDHSVSTRSRASSHASRDTTLTDASSVEASSPVSPKANHLSGYFPSGGRQLKKSASTTSLQQVKEEIVEPVPAIPSRAISHSKRAHERLAHKRSLQSVPGRTSLNSRSSGSVRSSREQRSSLDMFKATIEEEAHPFGRELEQLNEIVEEFGGVVRDVESEADLTAMRSKNLAAFCAADYLSEIQPLFSSRFGLAHQAPPMAWI